MNGKNPSAMQIYQLDITPQNLLFILNVVFHRILFRLTNNQDPISAPYLSGDTFRSLAKYKYDAKSTFDPKSVSEKDIIFVGFSHLKQYFEQIHPKITKSYILITHNGDLSIDRTWVKYIDQKIIHWFSQNVDVVHPKLTPIPIGLENLDYYNHGVPGFYRALASNSVNKKSRILFGFSIHTNRVARQAAFNFISKHPEADRLKDRLNGYEYLKVAREYEFVLSPPGNGVDCMRTWEAIYLGSVPIVKRSVMSEYFEKLGLPIWVVGSWSQLSGYTSAKFHDTYNQIMKKSKLEPMFMPYWRDQIESYAK